MKPRLRVLVALFVALVIPTVASCQQTLPETGWQKYWQQLNAYAHSPEAKRYLDGSVAKGKEWIQTGEKWIDSVKLHEKVALLAEFWRNRDSIDLLCLLQPENLRLLTSIDLNQLQIRYSQWQSSLENRTRQP